MDCRELGTGEQGLVHLNETAALQNRTRDIEIKNKLTVTRAEWRGDNGRKKGKGHQGTYIKDTWMKPKGGRIKGER